MNNIYSTALAKVLKQWREDFGYTVSQIAKKLGANPHTIARFESGKGGISLEVGLKYLDLASGKMPTNSIWKQYLAELRTAKESTTATQTESIITVPEGVCDSLTPPIAIIDSNKTSAQDSADSTAKSNWFTRLNPFK